MKTRKVRFTISLAVLIIAVVMIITGMNRTHKVYNQKDSGAFEGFNLLGNLEIHRKISEKQLIIDATFGGVERGDEGKLYSTYDRSKPVGKRKCPT